jgi:hypothetical protein
MVPADDIYLERYRLPRPSPYNIIPSNINPPAYLLKKEETRRLSGKDDSFMEKLPTASSATSSVLLA